MTARDDFDTVPLRVPPHSREAEQALLGGLLLDNTAFERAADLVEAADFYHHEHRLIWSALAGLIRACKPADVVTVFERLQAERRDEDMGGLPYLNALAMGVPSASNARRYAEIVRERAVLRAVIALSDAAATAAFNPQGRSAVDVVAEIAAKVQQLDRRQLRKAPKPLAEILRGRVDHIQALNDGTARGGMSTGIPALDRALGGGLRPGGVYILAARPSIGKSSLAQAIGLHCAEHEGPTLMLSQEMPDTELADRALANLGPIAYDSVQTGKLSHEEWGALSRVVESSPLIPYFIDDQPALRLQDIRGKARQVDGLRLLIVDYLQLSVGEGDNRTQEIGSLSRGLKAMAKEQQIPLIVLSQLSRKAEDRPGGEPELPDLRDSGEIEQDADVVMLLWQAQEFDGGAKQVGCKLAKNRQGRRGVRIALHFDGARQRWHESTEPLTNVTAAKTATSKGNL